MMDILIFFFFSSRLSAKWIKQKISIHSYTFLAKLMNKKVEKKQKPLMVN